MNPNNQQQSNRLQLNFGFQGAQNFGGAEQGRAYPTTPSTFPQPFPNTQGQQEVWGTAQPGSNNRPICTHSKATDLSLSKHSSNRNSNSTNNYLRHNNNNSRSNSTTMPLPMAWCISSPTRILVVHLALRAPTVVKFHPTPTQTVLVPPTRPSSSNNTTLARH
jgi:hypothetical protein